MLYNSLVKAEEMRKIKQKNDFAKKNLLALYVVVKVYRKAQHIVYF